MKIRKPTGIESELYVLFGIMTDISFKKSLEKSIQRSNKKEMSSKSNVKNAVNV